MTIGSHGDRRPRGRSSPRSCAPGGSGSARRTSACRPAPGAAPPDCGARSSPSSPGSASPGTPGLSRGARSTRASRCSTPIATTLRLDAVERAHLFRLADLPGAAAAADCPDCPLPPEVQQVLDAIRFPACVLTERFDVIAWNQVYAAIFPGICEAPPGERNTLLVNLTAPSCCSPLQDQASHCLALVGQLRAAYGRHVGDPAWTHFIRRLEARQPGVRAGLGVPRGGAADPAHQALPPPDGSAPSPPPRPASRSPRSPAPAWSSTPPMTSRARRRSPGWPRARSCDARFPCWNDCHPERARLAPAAV